MPLIAEGRYNMQWQEKAASLCRRAFKPITVMLIPHESAKRSINVNIPAAAILAGGIFSLVGLLFVCSFIPDAISYRTVEAEMREYPQKMAEFNATLLSLKATQKDLQALVSLGSREKILEKVDTSDMGAFDVQQVQKHIETSMQTVASIKDYLRTQKDIYMATPRGWPVAGQISSPYGGRINPISGRSEIHRGIDISARAGEPVLATADGVVSFAGWSGGGGNLIVLAHGHGYVTYYAHNQRISVKVGQEVNRGDVIGYVGSTGSSTGSHCHYEVWKEGQCRNPLAYLEGRS